MAASDRLTLLSPTRVWVTFNGLFFILACATIGGYYQIAAKDNRRLIVQQEQTLSRARVDDLRERRFRTFVEGIGASFSSLYVRVDYTSEHFEFGQPARTSHCASSRYSLENSEATAPVTVTMCRPFDVSTGPIAALFAGFLVVSLASLQILRRLDARAASELSGFLSDSGVPIDAGAGLISIMAGMRAISEKLREARTIHDQLVRERTRADIAAQVGHDIRAPLGALHSDLGRYDRLEKTERDLVLRSIDRIKQISEDLLRAPTPPPVVQIPVDRIAEILQALSKDTGVRFQSDVQSFRPTTVGCDLPLLERVTSNLLTNAIQATQNPDAVFLSISELCDSELCVLVQDHGPGIPPPVLSQLGRRGATFGKPSGTGLGLWHAKTTLESWGGRLEIESEVGKGTTVRLILPRADAPAPGDGPADAVLIDDDPLVRMSWTVAAKRAGKSLRAYSDADSFMKECDALPKATPLFIDSDLGEGVTGEEVARRLAERGFTALHLSTGHDPASFPSMPFLKGIRGKEPPWA